MAQAASHRIELRLGDLHQLFDSMDPSPFHERDLDPEAQEFIVSWAREAPADAPLRLVIHLARPPAGLDDPEGSITDSIRHYFTYRAGLTRRELRQLLRDGRSSLLIGLAFLTACQLLPPLLLPSGPGTWQALAREGLAILGWVAMWHPLDLLLYRWWPVRRTLRLYRKLAQLEIELDLPSD